MTLEDRLQEALARRAEAVAPAEPEWSRIAGRLAGSRRRSRRVRWTMAGTSIVAVALVVLGVLVLVGNGPSDRPLSTAGPPLLGATTTTVALATSTTFPALMAAGVPPGGPVPAGFRPVSVTWVSTTQGWALGTAPCASPPCTSMVRTTDGGATWKGVPAPRTELYSPPADSGVSKVRFADEVNGWVYGPELWVTHDGGGTWRRQETLGGPTMSLEASLGVVYAVVGASTGRVFTSDVDADQWRGLGAADVFPFAGLALQGGTGYVMGADGTVRALSAAGSERRGAPCAPATPALAVAGPGIVAVCVTGAALGSSTKVLMVSLDGARTWKAAGSPPNGGQPSAVAASSFSSVVVAAASGASYLYRTEDGGATWTTVHTEPDGGAGIADLGFTTPSQGVVIFGANTRDSHLLATTDAGMTWTRVAFGP